MKAHTDIEQNKKLSDNDLNGGKIKDRTLFFGEDDDDYNSKFDDEEFMVGIY